MVGWILGVLFGTEEPRKEIVITNMEHPTHPWKLYVDEIMRIYTDKDTDLCVIEMVSQYVWCYETTEEVLMLVAEQGGLVCRR